MDLENFQINSGYQYEDPRAVKSLSKDEENALKGALTEEEKIAGYRPYDLSGLFAGYKGSESDGSLPYLHQLDENDIPQKSLIDLMSGNEAPDV